MRDAVEAAGLGALTLTTSSPLHASETFRRVADVARGAATGSARATPFRYPPTRQISTIPSSGSGSSDRRDLLAFRGRTPLGQPSTALPLPRQASVTDRYSCTAGANP